MNDERMRSVLDAWFEDTDPQPPNARTTATHVMARVPRIRQRGRWSPFPLFRREAQTPTATPTATTEYQPKTIPASNGQTPTVIGRTTSMFSPVKAITAGAIVFALGGAFLIAQPFDQQGSVPGADVNEATTEPSAPAIVTGWSRPRGDVTQEGTEAEVDGVIQSRGFVREGDRLEMDDPRLTGNSSTMWNTDLHTVGDAGAALIAVSKRIENEEGSWSGSCTSLVYVHVPPSEDSPYIESCLLTGAGAYDGLSAYLTQVTTGTPNSPVEGLIFAGDPPPVPEMPPAE